MLKFACKDLNQTVEIYGQQHLVDSERIMHSVHTQEISRDFIIIQKILIIFILQIPLKATYHLVQLVLCLTGGISYHNLVESYDTTGSVNYAPGSQCLKTRKKPLNRVKEGMEPEIYKITQNHLKKTSK